MLSLTDIARNSYRFGRKSSLLECITPWSEPQIQQPHQSITLVSTGSGRTCAGMCNIPVKHPCSTGVAWVGGSLRGFVHTGHTLVGWGFLHLLHFLQHFRDLFIQMCKIPTFQEHQCCSEPTPVWRPETDTSLLLISHKGVLIIVTYAEIKILSALTALTELSFFYFASS